jgi:metallo-beta-lactamase class B
MNKSLIGTLSMATLAVGQVSLAESRSTEAPRPIQQELVAPCKADASWTDPAPATHIYGNVWYVGTCALSVILITSAAGDILIDGGTAEAPPLIEANIRALGFKVADVRYVLNSHAHHDHAGGIEQLRHDSGAAVVARGADADAIERGYGDRSDPQFLTNKHFTPVAHVQRVTDGQAIVLGPLVVTAHATPGHTPGSTTWTWQSCEKSSCVKVVYADSLTALSDDAYRFSDQQTNPGALAGFRASIDLLASLPCDILLTPHPGASRIWQRIGPAASAPLIDPMACKRYADAARAELNKRIAAEETHR